MGVDLELERKRLSQAKFLQWISRKVSPSEMITVYLSEHDDDHSLFMYCCLIPNSSIGRRLKDLSWDFSVGDGHPGASVHFEGGEEVAEYLRYGDPSGIEPLVISRQFYGMREDYLELNEEFRLFHRLYHDRKKDHFIKIDDAGNEHLVAVIEPKKVLIRLLEIQQFLAIKEMHLAVMFDVRENSKAPLAELGIEKAGKETRDGLLAYGLFYGDLHFDDCRAFSRFLGKRLFPPFPKEKSGLWGFRSEDKKKYIDFIIGTDEYGDEITNTSNPDLLANFFGANPEEPNYLTPVHFRKEVLDKYYQQPSKFSVEDGLFRCGSLWSMTMDNHHDNIVIAWLGDLGRDLPYEEQLHWRGYNIPPASGVSKTFYKRQIMAQFADSEHPDHVFKYRYQDLQKACTERLGWQILLPLSAEDAHFLAAVRIPSNDEQKDFDELILSLTKILVDSLNERKLNQLLPASDLDGLKGSISRLEKVLSNIGAKDTNGHIKFLRDLQSLRSSGAAHRKGSNYKKIAAEVGVESQSLRLVFQGILEKAILFLEYLNDNLALVSEHVFVDSSKEPEDGAQAQETWQKEMPTTTLDADG